MLPWSGPTLPARVRVPAAQRQPRITKGYIGFIHLGYSVVHKAFGGTMFKGIVTSHQFPFLRGVYEDGDSEDLTSKKLAKILHITKADVADPRRFAYDWGSFNPGAVPGFVGILERLHGRVWYGFASSVDGDGVRRG